MVTCALIVLVDGALFKFDRLATQLLIIPREGAIAPPDKMSHFIVLQINYEKIPFLSCCDCIYCTGVFVF